MKPGPKPRPVADRLWPKADVRDPGECWLWTAATAGKGYGAFFDGERRDYAHRVAYALAFGPIPVGLEIDHLCRNRLCINPLHLEAVTPRVNHMRSPITHGGKSHCKRGHPFDESNTRRTRDGRRQCRACAAAHARAYYAAHRS